MNTTPVPLTRSEWNEVAALDIVRQSWGLESDESGETFAQTAYGVKFAFVSGGPGYVGDLYIIMGDSFGGPPLVLMRDEQKHLTPVHF